MYNKLYRIVQVSTGYEIIHIVLMNLLLSRLYKLDKDGIRITAFFDVVPKDELILIKLFYNICYSGETGN